MKRYLPFIAAACIAACATSTAALAGSSDESPEVTSARRARDQANIQDLQQVIASAADVAKQRDSAGTYEQLALFDYWLCEAAHAHGDNKLIKRVARDGVAAAEKAVALDPNSSNAHVLEGELLGELIPQVFAGGMRYGQRSVPLPNSTRPSNWIPRTRAPTSVAPSLITSLPRRSAATRIKPPNCSTTPSGSILPPIPPIFGWRRSTGHRESGMTLCARLIRRFG